MVFIRGLTHSLRRKISHQPMTWYDKGSDRIDRTCKEGHKGPGGEAQLVGASSHAPKVEDLIPREGAYRRQPMFLTLMFLSPSFIINKYIIRWGLKIKRPESIEILPAWCLTDFPIHPLKSILPPNPTYSHSLPCRQSPDFVRMFTLHTAMCSGKEHLPSPKRLLLVDIYNNHDDSSLFLDNNWFRYHNG